MNDIRPSKPKTPVRPTAVPSPTQSVGANDRGLDLSDVELSIAVEATDSNTTPRRRSRLFWLVVALCSAMVVLAAVVGVSYIWYRNALTPLSGDENAARLPIKIEPGTTPDQIAKQLYDKRLIRSELAFMVYTRQAGTQHKLQAGSYRLSPGESTPAIVDHLLAGNIDTISIMFYPGATLRDTTNTPEENKVDVATVLGRAGYSDQEITVALNKQYDHPVFKDKPASADLEGYVYGQTYEFSTGATVEDILMRTFDELYQQVKDNDLEVKLKKRGLNLYEGITLASIVQREIPDATEQDKRDQATAAGIFYNRLKMDMQLGSDVTYHYIADKTGVPRDYRLQSPYNTRQVTGLPPGPISAPGAHALMAVANPVNTKYIYFLSGDDNKTYFATTETEHEANIQNHCARKCSLP